MVDQPNLIDSLTQGMKLFNQDYMEMERSYLVSCVLCGSTRELSMFAHRAKDSSLVGWLFACEDCEPRIVGKTIEIVVS